MEAVLWACPGRDSGRQSLSSLFVKFMFSVDLLHISQSHFYSWQKTCSLDIYSFYRSHSIALISLLLFSEPFPALPFTFSDEGTKTACSIQGATSTNLHVLICSLANNFKYWIAFFAFCWALSCFSWFIVTSGAQFWLIVISTEPFLLCVKLGLVFDICITYIHEYTWTVGSGVPCRYHVDLSRLLK